ncbi:hypothetical protein M514_19667 [Trichuris suis]|uniref:Uncharacterized protein n=1 Tax=Trichuris suis TaxID=68888 RepID=A0A085NFD9_9BILA|nr:hypothetical protein M514_19661 [Trichuris suis]KFD68185.1 hypothetical protein M514_19667 [Trichuris suis]
MAPWSLPTDVWEPLAQNVVFLGKVGTSSCALQSVCRYLATRHTIWPILSYGLCLDVPGAVRPKQLFYPLQERPHGFPRESSYCLLTNGRKRSSTELEGQPFQTQLSTREMIGSRADMDAISDARSGGLGNSSRKLTSSNGGIAMLVESSGSLLRPSAWLIALPGR